MANCTIIKSENEQHYLILSIENKNRNKIL